MTSTLIIEDGSIVPNANSYASATYASNYFTLRNISAWAQESSPEAQLLRAMDFLYRVFHNRWSGYRYSTAQALDWPRLWVPILDLAGGFGSFPIYIAPTVIPDQLLQAQCELALRFSTLGSLITDLDIRVLSEKVGSIQVDYDPNSPAFIVYREIDMILQALLDRANPGNAKMIR